MYKSQLHILCQKKAWPQPTYTVSRSGPQHDSRFQATVTVNGRKFNGSDLSRTSKEAQDSISQVALNHFASSPPGSSPHEVSQDAFNQLASGPPGSSRSTIAAGSKLSCTSQLQAYAEKYLPHLPVYTYACQGSDQALRYKAEVIVGERTFRSMLFFNTLEEAENDAAKTALLHLPFEETNNTQDDPVSYMALLDELAQKAGMKMPVYKTGSNGASYMPVFSSVVDVGNNSFFGEVATSKIQAEMNAAKVAWLKLNVDKKGENEITVQNNSGLLVSSRKIQQDTKEQNKFNGNNASPSAPLPAQQSADIIPEIVSACHARPANSSFHYNRVRVYKRKGGMVLPEGVTVLPFSDATWVAVSLDSPSIEGNDANSGKASHLPDSSECVPLNSQSAVSKNVEQSEAIKIHHGRILDNKGENEIIMQRHSGLSVSSLKNQIDTTEQNKFSGIDVSPSAFLPAQGSADNVPRISSACHKRPANSLLYNRVRVYPRKADMVLPEGVTLLPFSDANWVAVSLDSNFEDVEMAGVGESHSKSLLKPTGRIGKMKKKQHLGKGRRRRGRNRRRR